MITTLQKVALLCVLMSVTMMTHGQTLTIDPGDKNQQVTFGGDGKLTIKDWAEKNVSTTAQKLFGDMDLKIIRVPIFALQPITDSIYDNVITVIQEVQSVNPNVKVFASIANGDGYGVNHHNADKFPSGWIGCCSYNVYSLNLTSYAAYLDSFMNRMSTAGITVDYLGPWNEDPADDSDHRKVFDQMNNLGSTQKVGLERYALQTSIDDVNDVEDRTDIIGSHFYDDGTLGQANWESKWASLVSLSADPVWYTESTRYSTADNLGLLVDGMDNIFPAINAGAEAVVFYQVVKRFVYANGNELPIKYSGFKALVNGSEGKEVIETSSSDSDIQAVAFADNNTAEVYLLNRSSSSKTVNFQLQSGYKASGTVSRWIWDATNTEKVNTYYLGNNASWNVTVPADGFVRVQVPLSAPGSRVADELVEEELEELEGFNIYPNPVLNGKVSISTPELDIDLPVNITLFTIEGRKIQEVTFQNSQKMELNIGNSMKGLFLLRIVQGDFMRDEKVLFR
ncbi:MAG: T9SS type A sorting domain-containing protein [Cyclobacteriaceae bacterium]